ncbi:hypothetical protein ALP79_05450, partial [Pseudomonas savastanoi pv. fraxini]
MLAHHSEHCCLQGVVAVTTIKITAGGYEFLAEANPDAPQTVEAFLKLLPYRQKFIHVRWSADSTV